MQLSVCKNDLKDLHGGSNEEKKLWPRDKEGNRNEKGRGGNEKLSAWNQCKTKMEWWKTMLFLTYMCRFSHIYNTGSTISGSIHWIFKCDWLLPCLHGKVFILWRKKKTQPTTMLHKENSASTLQPKSPAKGIMFSCFSKTVHETWHRLNPIWNFTIQYFTQWFNSHENHH